MADAFTIGFRTMCGVVDEATYGVETLVTEPLVISSETLTPAVPLITPPALDGRAQQREGYAGPLTIGGDIVVPLRYGIGHPFFRNWFGAYDAATGTYTHAPTTAGQSMTVAIRKGNTVWAFMGVKIHQLVLNATPDLVSLTASVYATDYTKNSAINTIPVLNRFIDPALDVRYRDFREADGQSSIWIGEETVTLSTTYKVAPGTFTLTLGRPMDQVQTNEGIAEPAENAYPPITLVLAVPHHTSNVYQAWFENKTTVQVRIRFARGTEFKQIVLPGAQVDAAPVNIAGPGAPPQNVTLAAREAERTITSPGISAAASDNSLNISNTAGTAATGTLTLTGVSTDGQTVTIGGRVYEIDTQTFPGGTTPGHVRVDLNAAATKAQGMLTILAQPTATDTMTIGTKVYTFVTNATADADGEINVGTNLATAQANILAAINGTDGINTAHTLVTIAPFVSDDAIITAKAGGTGGNSIVTTETFTSGSNVFDATTLGTTTAGVSPTASATVTALVAAITGDDEALVTAVDGAGDTVVVTAEDVGVDGNSIATTETMANASWGAVTLTGGVDPVTMPYCWPGATIWIEGMTAGSGANNGVAEVVSRTAAKIVITTAANGGITLIDEAAGASVTLTTRTPDVIMSETAA